jgi:hypothetical protein
MVFSWGYGKYILQGGLNPNKISGVGTIPTSTKKYFGLLVHVLPGPSRRRVIYIKKVIFRAELGDKTNSPVASFVLDFHITIIICVIRGDHVASSIIENTCREGVDRIFRQGAHVRT